MLGGEILQRVLDTLQKRFDKINHKYIQNVAAQVAKIGELNASSINRLTEMAEMTAGAEEVKTMLEQSMNKTRTDIDRLFTRTMKDVTTDPRFTRAFSSGRNLEAKDRKRMEQYANLVYMQTAGELENLSRTTLVSENYRRAVDDAIMAVNAGIADYGSSIRDILRRTGSQGIQVVYPSGAHRRFDTALRQNILDGAKQVSQQGSKIVGEALQYDAWELTAHLHAAPDHEPVQGHIFLNEEFERLQAGYDFKDINGRHFMGFPRSIGQWNCMHMALPFSTKYSTPTYTERQLQEWQEQNAQGCEFRGKHMTIYEASQMMRKMETRVHELKDTAIAAQAGGDDVLRRECQYKINTLARQYKELSEASGLAQQKKRMTVEGFRPVKANKQLTNAAGKPVIEVKHTTINGSPNTITQFTNKKGGIDRNYYGEDGKQTKQISNYAHGHPIEERIGDHGEHAHDYRLREDGRLIRGEARPLTEDERRENDDILNGGTHKK